MTPKKFITFDCLPLDWMANKDDQDSESCNGDHITGDVKFFQKKLNNETIINMVNDDLKYLLSLNDNSDKDYFKHVFTKQTLHLYVEPFKRFYPAFTYLWRLCCSFNLETGYITGHDVCKGVKIMEIIARKNDLTSNYENFSKYIHEDHQYKTRGELLFKLLKYGVRITPNIDLLSEYKINSIINIFLDGYTDIHLSEEIFNRKILLSDMLDSKAKQLDWLIRKCILAIGFDRQIDHKVAFEFFEELFQKNKIDLGLLRFYIILSMPMEYDYNQDGFEKLSRTQFGDLFIKLATSLCDLIRRNFNISCFNLKEINLSQLLGKIADNFDVVSDYVESKILVIFEQMGFIEKIPGVYEFR